MTNEEKAQEEWMDVLRWATEESFKVMARLKKEGIPGGLDTDQEHYAYIHQETYRRLDEIRGKYGIKPKNELA